MKNTFEIRMSMRKISISLCLVFTCLLLKSEGTRELAPNANTVINTTTTNDLAALHINSPEFNNFAAFNGTNVNSRLHIHISDPLTENIFLGFSYAHTNGSTTPLDYEYRILDPNGSVVFGPVTVNGGSENITTWAEAFAGPSQLVGASGYNATQVNAIDLISGGWGSAGDYYIEFRHLGGTQPILIDYWDITVVNNNGSLMEEKKGRLWSYNWALFAINDFGFPERPFNGSFYVCAPDVLNPETAFVTQIDFNNSGFMPAAFNIAFNSFGTMNTGNISNDRRSRENINSATPEYAIFLNDPVDICDTATAGGIDILSISRCNSEDYCINFISTRAGQIDLLLDFDGRDDVFTPGTADIMITQLVEAGDVNISVCLPWDGRDGLGNLLSENIASEIPISLSFAQGIYHFPIYDAERMSNGFQINNVRPTGPQPLLYYDDSNISVPSGTSEPTVQLMGCDLPCHGWTNYTDGGTVGFGNLNTINSWWFSQQTMNTEVLFMPSSYTCSIVGNNTACEGEVVTLEVVTEYGPDSGMASTINNLNWTGPGIVSGNGTNSVEINASGVYGASFDWENNGGQTCPTACEFSFTLNQVSESVIDTILDFGETLTVNSEIYDVTGTYTQTLMAANGCDSILTIIVEIDIPEVTLDCSLQGPTELCQGETGTIDLILTKLPQDAPDPEILRIDWFLNSGNIASDVSSINVNQPGNYLMQYTWVNLINDTITQECTWSLDVFPTYEVQIDTIIGDGETLDINGIIITGPGEFINNDLTSQGCDSTVIINVIQETSVIYYSLDDCKSSDYSKFTPEYPTPLDCAELDASIVYRENEELNRHSCTPGIHGGVGLCVSSDDDCNYNAGSEKSTIIQVVVNPGEEEAVQLTSMRFYERAPEEFQWIVGTEGLNNYPTLYGLRVIKNGQEIYRSTDNATSLDWTSEIFNFAGLEDFKVQEPSLFRFEFLSYCLVGNESDVTAWDLDEISIQADCAAFVSNMVVVQGKVNNINQEPLSDVGVDLKFGNYDFQKRTVVTNQDGEYAFDNVLKTNDYMIQPVSGDDYLNGVSTLDLIHIQRHVLGLEIFDSPYQMIAADTDNSRSITVVDILELRKLILGINDKLTNNKSWRFIQSNQELHVSNPWNIKEVKHIDNISTDKSQSFTGVKIGDVNNDNISFQSTDVIERRSNASAQLSVSDQKVTAGKMTQVKLDFDNDASEILGFQLALHLNNLEVVSIENENLIEGVHFVKDNDRLLISSTFVNASSIEIPESLTLNVLPKSEGLLSEMLSIDNTSINSELYYGNDIAVAKIQLSFDTNDELTEGYTISNTPNPFTNTTSLRFDFDRQENAFLNVYDLTGQIVYSQSIQIQEGENKVNLNAEHMKYANGILIYEVLTSTEKLSGRMILIK